MQTRLLIALGIIILSLAPLLFIGKNRTTASRHGHKAGQDKRQSASISTTDETRSTRRKHTHRKVLSEEEMAKLSFEQYLRHKTNTIIIPLVDFDNTTIEEALDFLRLRARELDPAKEESMKGLGIMIRKPSAGSLHEEAELDPVVHAGRGINPDIGSIRVNTKGENMTLAHVLDQMCLEAKLQWKIADGKIILEPLD